jgi:Ca2+-transporting ATPase
MWSAILLNGFVVALLSLLFLTSDWTHTLFPGGHLNAEAKATTFATAFFTFFVFLHIFNTLERPDSGTESV